MMDMALAGALALLILLIVLSAAEGALLALSNDDRQHIRSQTGQIARAIGKVIADPTEYLITFQLSLTLTLMGFTLLATDRLLEERESEGFWLALALLPPVLLVLGQLLPRAIAASRPRLTSSLLIFPFLTVHWLLYPLRYPLHRLGALLMRMVGIAQADNPRLEESEIKTLVDIGEQEGALRESERTLIHKVFAFDDMMVSQVMTPRTEVIGFSINTPVERILSGIKAQRYARVPIYRNTLDSVLGVLYTKDLLALKARGETAKRHLKDMLHPAYFVPETKKADELFRDFQTQKIHLAVVVDEYGGVAGIVTMDDLLSAIFGTILDEHDEAHTEIVTLGQDEWRVAAHTDLEQFCEQLAVALPEEDDVSTVGGLVMSCFGSLPAAGDSIRYEGLEFTIESFSGTRLKHIHVRRLVSETPTEPEVAS